MLRDISLISKKKKKNSKFIPRLSLVMKVGATEFLSTAAQMSSECSRGGSGCGSLIQSCSEEVCLEPGLLSWAETAQRVGVALSEAQRGGLGVVCVQTALQTPGRRLEWESLLHPRQGEFWGAPGLLCTCWIPMSTMEEMVLSGEAGCCNPQERECGCRQARLGVLRSLFSPRRASRVPRVRWGGLAETGCSGYLDQKDCFLELSLF